MVDHAATQLSLDEGGWPLPNRFPHNSRTSIVRDVVDRDLLNSHEPLIITGYTALDTLVSLLASLQERGQFVDTVRALLGHEPTPTGRQSFSWAGHRFGEEIRDYWLEHGISLYLSAQVIAAVDLFRSGKAEARISAPNQVVHAKVYKGDSAITLGSSNYSRSGLVHQAEANVRFALSDEEARFIEAGMLAEQIWRLGVDYTPQLLDLLRQLLQVVTWQEALARACGEVLEGPWANGTCQ